MFNRVSDVVFVIMNDSGKPQRVENLPKMSSNSTFRADDSEASAGLVRDKPRNGGPDSVRVDGGSKNSGQLNALVSKRHAKDLTRPKSSHKRGRHDTESESIKGFSDQEILFDVEGNHEGLLSGDDGDNIPRPNVLMHHPDSDFSDIDGQDRDRHKVSDHIVSLIQGSRIPTKCLVLMMILCQTMHQSCLYIPRLPLTWWMRNVLIHWAVVKKTSGSCRRDKRVFVTNLFLSMSVKWLLKIAF